MVNQGAFTEVLVDDDRLVGKRLTCGIQKAAMNALAFFP